MKELNSITGPNSSNNIEIDDDTVELLQKTFAAINNLIDNSSVRKTKVANKDDIIHCLTNENITYQRYFRCDRCNVSDSIRFYIFSIEFSNRFLFSHIQVQFEINQNAFENHVNSREHLRRIRDRSSHRRQQTNSFERNYANPTNQMNKMKSTNVLSVLRNWNDLVEIANSIKPEAVDLLLRSDKRISMETKITTIIKKYIKIFDSNLNIYQYGSTCYGFGGEHTNLNFWIDTSM